MDGETSNGFTVAGLPPEVAGLLQLIQRYLQRPVYGGGATLAVDCRSCFASPDANYTESDLDIGDSASSLLADTTGINGSLGELERVRRCQYQDIDERKTARQLPDLGTIRAGWLRCRFRSRG